MNIAWITHRDWDRSGGAEMADHDMVDRRPDGIEIMAIKPGGVAEDLEDFDRIIVSGLAGYSAKELNLLQEFKDKMTFWIHDSQFAGHWFYTVPKNLIFVSPTHIKHDLSKIVGFPDKQVHVNPGWMNVEEILVLTAKKRAGALWAHRPVWQKGLDMAVVWAEQNNEVLDVLVGRQRPEVLASMRKHKYFILLPHEFDSGPRTVMEATLTGAECITNQNVGQFDEPIDELAERLSNADKHFWEVVLS